MTNYPSDFKAVPENISKQLEKKLAELSSVRGSAKVMHQAVQQKMKQRAYSKYYDYLQYVEPLFISGRHILVLCQFLERVASGDIKRLLISMPPRHSKSTCVTKNFPSWYMGKYPSREVILAAYGADLAEDFSRKNRENIRFCGKDIFGVTLSRDKQGVKRWEIADHPGALTAVGVDGPMMGRGASLAIIDDPIKGPEDANSKAYKIKLHNWYKTSLISRLSPIGAVVVVQTRWCEDDLIGSLLEEMENGEGEDWIVLSMPAIATEDDTTFFNRKKGEPLWPEFWTKKTLLNAKKGMGTYAWESLYQQNPVPYKDLVLKQDWLQYYDEPEIQYDVDRKMYYFRGNPIVKRVAAIDPATGDGTDYTGIGVADITANGLIIFLVLKRFDLSIPETFKKVLETYNIFKPHPFIVEEAGYQRAIRQILLASGHPIPFKAVVPDRRGKYYRISETSPFFEWGRVFILHKQHIFIEEYKMFPTGKNDDLLDVAEMIITFARGMPVFGGSGLITGAMQSDLMLDETEAEELSHSMTYTDYLFPEDTYSSPGVDNYQFY